MAFTVFRRLAMATAVVGLLAGAVDAAAQTALPAQTAQAAPAQPARSAGSVRILDEIKIGGMAHDVGLGGHHRESGGDVSLEVLFASPDIFKVLLAPRPHFGVDINSNGKTSSYYGGLTWGGVFYAPNWSRGDGFFGYFSAGGAVHDGKLDTTDRTRKSLGSRVLFREAIDIGYRFNDVISLATFVDHISNANLATRNEGLTNVGARLGFRF